MRYKRIRRFKKATKKLIIGFQLLTIWYTLTIAMIFLTSETMAAFTSSFRITGAITAGEWWDGSELAFVGKNTQNVKSCSPISFSVLMENNGNTMIDTTKYEVYYSEKSNGNPKQTGNLIAEGVLNPISQGEIIELAYTAEKDGAYMFKVYQREGYEGENKEIWSEKIIINCNADKDKKENEKQVDEQEESKTNKELPSTEATEENQKGQSEEDQKQQSEESISDSEDIIIDQDKVADENNEEKIKEETSEQDKETTETQDKEEKNTEINEEDTSLEKNNQEGEINEN